MVCQGVFLIAQAQQNPRPKGNRDKPQSNAAKAAKRYKLTIQAGDVVGVSLKADEARLSDIGNELSKSLKTRVVLGPSMEKELITVEFYDLTFEQATRLLAPHVYVDYEIRAGASPKPVGIFLFGENDPAPAGNAVVSGDAQALMIEGNTEDPTETSSSAAQDDPLQVELNGNALTVKSRKQPLAAVIMTIAEVLDVPAELKYDAREIVDTEIKETAYEDAIPRLSPNIRLYVRADLSRVEKKPLRLVLVAPPDKPATQ